MSSIPIFYVGYREYIEDDLKSKLNRIFGKDNYYFFKYEMTKRGMIFAMVISSYSLFNIFDYETFIILNTENMTSGSIIISIESF